MKYIKLFENFINESTDKKFNDTIKNSVKKNTSVLVYGNNGSGKEYMVTKILKDNNIDFVLKKDELTTALDFYKFLEKNKDAVIVCSIDNPNGRWLDGPHNSELRNLLKGACEQGKNKEIKYIDSSNNKSMIFNGSLILLSNVEMPFELEDRCWILKMNS